MAYRGDEIVGRVAAIINHRANDTWHKKEVRFGWLDFIDEEEVSAALLDAVAKWGKEKGMEAIVGPLGFTDMDAEGMLVEGFDQLGTMATIYNYSYYPEHMEQLGFQKEADWVEYKLTVPHQLPDKFVRISEIILQKYKLKIKKLKRSEIKKQHYGQKIFDLINEAYAPLYGYSQMTQGQINQYVKMYLPLIDLRMVSLVEDEEGNLVAVGIAMPSLSVALQKAKGKMLPFGWYYLLKALFIKRPRVLDLLLVGVKPEYQSKGVNALLFYDLVPIFQQWDLNTVRAIRNWNLIRRCRHNGVLSSRFSTSAAGLIKNDLIVKKGLYNIWKKLTNTLFLPPAIRKRTFAT